MRALFGTWVLVLSVAAVPARAASFDCAKAASKVEKMICADPVVSQLDSDLARDYSSARPALGAGATCLVSDQRQWLRTVRNRCASVDCLKHVYRERLVELNDLQASAAAPLGTEFPAVKKLAWMLPPAEDQVAAPRDARRPALVLQGRLVDDTAEGDGYVLQTDDGVKHPVLMLMFMADLAGVHLEALASAGARVEVRGQRETNSEGISYFSPGACIAIHRLPAR
jgi:uncharacterized protein